MVKCLECGFESNRLQWTHFKYNCNGKFANGKEYRAAHPGAELVSKELAKSTAVTFDNMVKKHGIIEGSIKWNIYKSKQAYTNSYKHKKEKYGWTIEQYNEYNSSRSQTLEKMIGRHGETIGTKKWLSYCDRQSYTNTKEYFIKKYGEEKGSEEFQRINSEKANASSPIKLSEKLGISLDEAVNIIADRYKLAYTSEIENDFVSKLTCKLGNIEYSNLTKPYGKWNHETNQYYVFDIKHKDVIIEFNGDYWHANPKKYDATDKIRGKLASCIWSNDKAKLDLARSFGFRVLVVWESDYKTDKDKIINEVIKWIQNGQP